MENDFIIMWDCNGLERIVDITVKAKMDMMAILAGVERPSVPELSAMLLRARFNSQRNYEIYAIRIDQTEEAIVKMFTEDNPQIIVNFIRKHGYKIFSERQQPPVII